jgi:hypothetical protein
MSKEKEVEGKDVFNCMQIYIVALLEHHVDWSVVTNIWEDHAVPI